jgi:hypothetical protein
MDAKERWIAAALEEGWELPEEVFDLSEYSGKFTIRMPKSLHRRLVLMAYLEGVSLNQYVLYLLSGGSPRYVLHVTMTPFERTSEAVKEQWETLDPAKKRLRTPPDFCLKRGMFPRY